MAWIISIHAPRVGRDGEEIGSTAVDTDFNPRAPCGARPVHHLRRVDDLAISIHAPRVGRDLFRPVGTLSSYRFQSTRPVWGATAMLHGLQVFGGISIHAPRVGRDQVSHVSDTGGGISIHAPRVGRDWQPPSFRRASSYFNPRAPCGARRYRPTTSRTFLPHFNPRAPCGARRPRFAIRAVLSRFQSTRPVWGATCARGAGTVPAPISIHAPRVGRDNCRGVCANQRDTFQSTRPVWGATDSDAIRLPATRISIHAPRVGRDLAASELPPSNVVFQSTRPVWGATFRRPARSRGNKFQSTRPVWGATRSHFRGAGRAAISIHAPRVGRDSADTGDAGRPTYFNPRAPCGARPCPARHLHHPYPISIHAPRVGRDYQLCKLGCAGQDFNPRAPCGARPRMRRQLSLPSTFQSTRPVWGATNAMISKGITAKISIHAPRVGRDATAMLCPSFAADFNPRAPCGARQQI